MHSFVTYLVEETSEEKLSHLEHGEDHVINAGDAGFKHAIDTLTGTHDLLRGEKSGVSLSTKYDGSPSVVFGHNPENGRFFVASKSIFNKEPKINYTDADIDRNHGHAPGLAKKLKEALKHMKQVSPEKGVFQGDFMYSKDDVKKQGRNYKFTPNTITYTADKDSAHGRDISQAQMGFVVHTAYKGTTLADMKATFNPSLSGFKKSKDVHLIKPSVDMDRVDYKKEDQQEFVDHMNRAIAEYQSAGKNSFDALTNSRENLRTYINYGIKNNVKPTPEGFAKYLEGSQQRDIDSVKTEKSKAEKKKKWDTIIHNAKSNKSKLNSVLEMHRHLQSAKNVLVKTMANASPFGHEINGKPTQPEGFVASLNNRPTKLVDRDEFSKANFEKNRGRVPMTDKLAPEPDNKITLHTPSEKEPTPEKKPAQVQATGAVRRLMKKKEAEKLPNEKVAAAPSKYTITPNTRNQVLGKLAKRSDQLGGLAKAELRKRQRISDVSGSRRKEYI
jgi:hypothetical protein